VETGKVKVKSVGREWPDLPGREGRFGGDPVYGSGGARVA